MFTALEFVLTGVHLAIILWCVVTGIRTSTIEVWSPRTIYALVALVYGIIGPVFLVYTENTNFLGAEMRPLYALGALAYLLSTTAFLCGYAVPVSVPRWQPRGYNLGQLENLCYFSLGAAVISMLVVTRGNLAALSPLASISTDPQIMQGQTGVAGAIQNYVFNFVHLSIPGLSLLLLINIKRPSSLRWVFLGGALLALLSVFISFGFRFRLIWILMTMISAFCISRNWRPNLLLSVVAVFLAIQILGIIGSTRTYFGGLDLAGANSQTSMDRLTGGLGETTIFFTTAAVIEAIPAEFEYSYLDPFWVALTFPIPRTLWAEKPTSQTIVQMVKALGGTAEMFESGPAVPYFGEYYIAFGWVGLLLSAFGFGYGMKRAWCWMLSRREDPLVVAIYATLVGLMQYIYSRGYLAQVLMFFAFSLLPFSSYYWWKNRRGRGNGVAIPQTARRKPKNR